MQAKPTATQSPAGDGVALQHIKESLAEEVRLRQQSVKLQEYEVLLRRFGCAMLPNGNAVKADLAYLWRQLGGADQWEECISPEQLATLLSKDERIAYVDRNAEGLPAGFFEQVLSRLPRLKRCSLVKLTAKLEVASLDTVDASCRFPYLEELDLCNSFSLDDRTLLALVRALPKLRVLKLDGCFNVTWEGIAAAKAAQPALAVCPETKEAKAAVDDEMRLLDMTHPTSVMEQARLQSQYGSLLEDRTGAGLLRLWEMLGETAGWRRTLTPARMTLLLSKAALIEAVRLKVSGYSEKGEGMEIAEDELPGFIAQVLARLPKLVKVSVLGAQSPSFDWATIKSVERPFPKLKAVYFRYSQCDAQDIDELCHLPSFPKKGNVTVDQNSYTGGDVAPGQFNCFVGVRNSDFKVTCYNPDGVGVEQFYDSS